MQYAYRNLLSEDKMPSHGDLTTECGDGGGTLIEGTVGGIERSYRYFDVLLNKLVSIVK